jgi:hypothetical protein
MARKTTFGALSVLAAVLLAGCTDVTQAPVQASARPVAVLGGGAKTIVRRPAPGELEPAAGGLAGAPGTPTVNVYLVNAEAGRPRCVMEVFDVICATTRTWNLCGGEEKVIAICADERGLGHARVRIANAVDENYSWAEYRDVAERDVLKR